MTDAYKAVDFFAPFKTMTLVASTKDNVTKATIVAQGDDADKVKAAKETLEGLLKETKAAMGTVESYKKAYVQPVVEGIDSIKIELDGAKATATGELKGFSAMRFFLSQSAEMMHMQEETQKRAQESKDRIMREDRIMRAVPPS
jgi:hypothetical protein